MSGTAGYNRGIPIGGPFKFEFKLAIYDSCVEAALPRSRDTPMPMRKSPFVCDGDCCALEDAVTITTETRTKRAILEYFIEDEMF